MNKVRFFGYIFVFWISVAICSAQEEYRHTYRVAYDYTEINHFDKKETKDLFYLDISPSVNRFMSTNRLQHKIIKKLP